MSILFTVIKCEALSIVDFLKFFWGDCVFCMWCFLAWLVKYTVFVPNCIASRDKISLKWKNWTWHYDFDTIMVRFRCKVTFSTGIWTHEINQKVRVIGEISLNTGFCKSQDFGSFKSLKNTKTFPLHTDIATVTILLSIKCLTNSRENAWYLQLFYNTLPVPVRFHGGS